MNNQQMIVYIKFTSELSFEEIMSVAQERIESFRAISGLRQKYYIRDPKTGEVGGIYVWESGADLEEYNRSELRASIAEAYKVAGAPHVEILEVVEVLR